MRLEDMNLEEETVNPVFQSWVLQHDAVERLRNTELPSQLYPQCCRTVLDIAMADLMSALELLAPMFDLEKAVVYTRLATVSLRQRRVDEALSHTCQALMSLQMWFSSNHPKIQTVKQNASAIASEVTLIFSSFL